jgi:hypothetical protein
MRDQRILVMDSVTKLAPEDHGKVLVAASHGGVYAGYLAAKGHARAVILNDASGGLEGAGYGCLAWADAFDMPAAVIDCWSARIGDGQDMIENGVVSHANAAARRAAVIPGMAADMAASKLLAAKMWVGDAPDLPESRFTIADDAGAPRVVGCDSASLIREDDACQIVVCASHGGLLAGASGYILKAPLLGVVLNDAGKGKGDAGIARVHAASAMGIAAVAVAASTARIGDARSTWETGIVSCVNDLAEAAGGKIGMTTAAVVDALIKSQA